MDRKLKAKSAWTIVIKSVYRLHACRVGGWPVLEFCKYIVYMASLRRRQNDKPLA